MEEFIRNSETLSAIKWYFELKNLSLRNALVLRCPLTAEKQKELRQYYSQYFVGLLSATDLFLERKYPHKEAFKDLLLKRLCFEGFPDGENNYFYLRELRNSIVHRGLDISSAAHIQDDFPLIVSPPITSSQNGKVSYTSFGYYLIEIIRRCESEIGDVFVEHIDTFGLFENRIPQEKILELSGDFILNSTVMPDWLKGSALDAIKDVDYGTIHSTFVNSLRETLKADVLSQYFEFE